MRPARTDIGVVPHSTELYWLAGLLEGEGSFLKGPPSRPRCPILQLAMTDSDIVARVADLFGRRVFRSDRGVDLGFKPAYLTALKGAGAAQLMAAVRPLMGARRQTQIDGVLATPHAQRVRWLHPGGRCSTDGCDGRVSVRGLCRRHYRQWWKDRRQGRRARVLPRDPSPRIDAREVVDLMALEPTDDRAVAWLAGLLEGEGTFGHSGGYPRIAVEMCDHDVLARAARILGGCPVYPVNDPTGRERGWSQTYTITVAGSRAADLMRLLRPLMGIRRCVAIESALAAYRPIRLVEPPASCVVTSCGAPHRSRGLCHKHYMSWTRDVKLGRAPRVKPLR